MRSRKLMRRVSLLTLLPGMLCIAALAFPRGLHAGEPNQEAPTPTTPAELLDAIRKIADENKVPGVSLAIVNRDEVLLSEGLGLADVESKRPVTTTTMFRAGSISKSFRKYRLVTAGIA